MRARHAMGGLPRIPFDQDLNALSGAWPRESDPWPTHRPCGVHVSPRAMGLARAQVLEPPTVGHSWVSYSSCRMNRRAVRLISQPTITNTWRSGPASSQLRRLACRNFRKTPLARKAAILVPPRRYRTTITRDPSEIPQRTVTDVSYPCAASVAFKTSPTFTHRLCRKSDSVFKEKPPFP